MFVCHSNPEDNEYTRWLATRLQLAGYKVWCDLFDLKGGEKLWDDIQKVLDNNAIKFVLVVSATTFQKDGVINEFEYARSLEKQHGLTDFIIPIKIDSSLFNARIGQNRYNHIDSVDYWAKGLKALLEKLEKDSVPKSNTNISNVIINTLHANHSIIKKKREIYYTNWWKIENLPDYFYSFKYKSESEAKLVLGTLKEFPVIIHGNQLISFDDQIPRADVRSNEDTTLISIVDTKISPIATVRISISDTIESSGDKLHEERRQLTWLLNRVFHLLAKRSGTAWYEMSGKSLCYFFTKDKVSIKARKWQIKNKVHILYPNGYRKTKNILGKYLNGYWHFGISSRAKLFPYPCFNLKSHILFSDNGVTIWDDPRRLHSSRRQKGKTWFNEQWRDQMMAFIAAMQTQNNSLSIPLNNQFPLKMPLYTVQMESTYGYNDPVSKERLGLNTEIDDELEDIDDTVLDREHNDDEAL